MSKNIKKAKIVCGLAMQNLKTVAFSCGSSLLCLTLLLYDDDWCFVIVMSSEAETSINQTIWMINLPPSPPSLQKPAPPTLHPWPLTTFAAATVPAPAAWTLSSTTTSACPVMKSSLRFGMDMRDKRSGLLRSRAPVINMIRSVLIPALPLPGMVPEGPRFGPSGFWHNYQVINYQNIIRFAVCPKVHDLDLRAWWVCIVCFSMVAIYYFTPGMRLEWVRSPLRRKITQTRRSDKHKH